MKRKLTVVAALCAFFVIGSIYETKAQSFKEGDWVVHAGIGLGHTYSYSNGGGIPFGAAIEYGITDLNVGSIGIGGDIGFASGTGWNTVIFGAKGSYHFNELFDLQDDRWDIYAGLGLYYRSFNWSTGWGHNISANSGVYPAFHVGARHYFSDNIGAFAELGNSWGWLNLGVAFKF